MGDPFLERKFRGEGDRQGSRCSSLSPISIVAEHELQLFRANHNSFDLPLEEFAILDRRIRWLFLLHRVADKRLDIGRRLEVQRQVKKFADYADSAEGYAIVGGTLLRRQSTKLQGRQSKRSLHEMAQMRRRPPTEVGQAEQARAGTFV